MFADVNFDDSLKNYHPSLWEIWSQKGYGPPAYVFGVVIPLPDGRLALVPVSEKGFEIEESTYLRDDHPDFVSCKPREPVLILYPVQYDTSRFIEPEFWAFLQDAIDRKKQASLSV